MALQRITNHQRRKVSSTPPRICLCTARGCLSVALRARLPPSIHRWIISETAKIPSRTGTMDSPSHSSRRPKVKRLSPVTLPIPTKEKSNPRAPAISPLFVFPLVPRTAMNVRASTASIKNSGGPKSRTTRLKIGSRMVSTNTPKKAPRKQAVMAAPTALPASPFSVIAGPSNRVAAFWPVPGVANRIAVTPPPWATAA